MLPFRPNLPCRWLAFCLLGVGFLPAPAQAGTVRTISGDTFEGEVRWDNGAATITNKGQPVQRVDLQNILRADFSTKKPEAEGIGPGVQLRSGALIGGRFSGIDATAVHMMVTGQPQDFPLANVSRVVFAALPESVARKVPAGFVGAILPGGDLYEGEFRGIDDKGQVKVNSPFLGVHRFNIKNGEILAVALRDLAPAAAPDAYRLIANDGSAYGTTSLLPTGDTVTLRDPIAGDIKVLARQLLQITAGPARVLPLGSLRAQTVDSVLPAKVPATYSSDSMPGGGAITMGDHPYDGGVTHAAGVSVTYVVPQGFSIFVAQAGLPAGAAPGVSVVFALLVDGRPAWRSQPVVAGAAPIPVRWNMGTTARLLKLTVEPAQPAALGTLAAWGDATLLKP